MGRKPSDPLTIRQYLAQWDRRWRTASSLRWGPRGLAAGLLVAVFLAIAARIWPLFNLQWLIGLAAGWGAIGLLASLLLVWLWPRPELESARFFDHRLKLKERISTALEIESGQIALPTEWQTKQLIDAQTAAAEADPNLAIPLRLAHHDWFMSAVALALLAAAIWLPNPMQAILAERAEVREVIEQQVEAVEAVREEIAADPELTEEDRQALLDILDTAVERLETGELSPEQALAELTEASDKLRDLMDNQAQEQAAALQDAAQGLMDSALTEGLAEALTNGDVQQAAAMLDQISSDLIDQMTPEQQVELAQQLAEAAAELAESNPELAEQLAQAAQNLQSGDLTAAQQALSQAAQTTAQTGQAAAAAQAAQQAAQQLAQSGQQIAQAGGQGQQAGQGNQGSQAGQSGQGSSQSQVQDGQGGGAGRGEGNSEGTGGQESPMNTDNGPGDGGLRQYEALYAPQRIGGEGGEEMQLPQSGDPGELLRELPSNPEIGQSTVPYNQIYADYAEAAGRALENQHIPLGMRGYVRDYFSSLEPEQ